MGTKQLLQRFDERADPAPPNPVVFRVLARDVRGAGVTFVAFSAIGLLALGFWGSFLVRILAPGAALARAASAALAGVVLLGAAFAAARHLRLRSSCSDPACEGAPGPHDAECPCCGAEIVATVSRKADRSAADGWYGIRLVRPERRPGGGRVLH